MGTRLTKARRAERVLREWLERPPPPRGSEAVRVSGVKSLLRHLPIGVDVALVEEVLKRCFSLADRHLARDLGRRLDTTYARALRHALAGQPWPEAVLAAWMLEDDPASAAAYRGLLGLLDVLSQVSLTDEEALARLGASARDPRVLEGLRLVVTSATLKDTWDETRLGRRIALCLINDGSDESLDALVELLPRLGLTQRTLKPLRVLAKARAVDVPALQALVVWLERANDASADARARPAGSP